MAGTTASAAASLPRGAGQRVLVVDDDPRMAELLETTLHLAGYTVATADRGAEALRAHATASPEAPDLLILDVMLPDMDGFTVCRMLAERGARVPTLLLTARDGIEDRVTGLALGADDYLTKPFSIPELLARVHALLRRAGRPGEPDRVLRFADLTLDEGSLRVRRAGRLISLSPTEWKLLHYLMLNADQVVSKDQIVDRVWHGPFDHSVVEKLVSRLRAKVDAQPPALIHTIRGFGYSLRLPAGQ
ncbi:response regulator transcription factor [Nonomuraea sp. NPDC049709]|uniref:response regulator transcription factor n=1 Tax=Nonomuraea sp. NPDC049709 TaxID=3154736 RepID=UPI0034230E07